MGADIVIAVDLLTCGSSMGTAEYFARDILSVGDDDDPNCVRNQHYRAT
jgi:hypothetical protein